MDFCVHDMYSTFANLVGLSGQYTQKNNDYFLGINQVTFVVSHFNDPRISSAELRDLLLQSISVLVQEREFLADFECNEAARQRMPKALLSAFDNRSWIPVTNILLRLCKGSGFGFPKRGESSSSSVLFQVTTDYCFLVTISCCIPFQPVVLMIFIFPFLLYSEDIAAGSLHQ